MITVTRCQWLNWVKWLLYPGKNVFVGVHDPNWPSMSDMNSSFRAISTTLSPYCKIARTSTGTCQGTHHLEKVPVVLLEEQLTIFFIQVWNSGRTYRFVTSSIGTFHLNDGLQGRQGSIPKRILLMPHCRIFLPVCDSKAFRATGSYCLPCKIGAAKRSVMVWSELASFTLLVLSVLRQIRL